MSKKVLNAAGMKMRNQKKILEILISTECSRAQLARKIGLTRSAVSVIIDELIESKYVIEGDPILGKVGRKSFVLKLNPDYCFMVGIDLARDGYHIGITNFCGKILYNYEMNIQESAYQTMSEITNVLTRAIKSHDFPGTLFGIGITAPGPLDSKHGKILNPPNFDQWQLVDVASYFHARFHCPVRLENNSNALALAEKNYGLGHLYNSYAELSVDTGIGCGVILNGKLYKGSSGFGNDFGHMSIDFNGAVCKCGNVGCAELYASIPNILHYAQTLDPSISHWNQIVDRAIAEDSTAKSILQKEAQYLAIVITNIMNILDVDAVIMSSSITYKGHLINNLIEEKVNKQSLSRMVKKVKIVPSSIVSHAFVLSAANLVLEDFLSL